MEHRAAIDGAGDEEFPGLAFFLVLHVAIRLRDLRLGAPDLDSTRCDQPARGLGGDAEDGFRAAFFLRTHRERQSLLREMPLLHPLANGFPFDVFAFTGRLAEGLGDGLRALAELEVAECVALERFLRTQRADGHAESGEKKQKDGFHWKR